MKTEKGEMRVERAQRGGGGEEERWETEANREKETGDEDDAGEQEVEEDGILFL